MRAFAHLLDRLSLTASRNAKLTLTRDFLRETPDPDRGWALAALTGNLSFKAPTASSGASIGRRSSATGTVPTSPPRTAREYDHESLADAGRSNAAGIEWQARLIDARDLSLHRTSS